MKQKHAEQFMSVVRVLEIPERAQELIDEIWSDEAEERDQAPTGSYSRKRQFYAKEVVAQASEMGRTVLPHAYVMLDKDFLRVLKLAMEKSNISTEEMRFTPDELTSYSNGQKALDLYELQKAAFNPLDKKTARLKKSIKKEWLERYGDSLQPRAAKIILEVLEELAAPEGCRPYVTKIWSEEAATKDVPPQELAEQRAKDFADIRATYPKLVAEDFAELLKISSDVTGHPNNAELWGQKAERPEMLDDRVTAVFTAACQKRGLSLDKIAPFVDYSTLKDHSGEGIIEFGKTRKKPPLEKMEDGRIVIDMIAVRQIADLFVRGGQQLGGKATEKK